MLFFTTRDKARNFANGTTRKFVDLGSDKQQGRRWAVKVTVSK